MSQTNRAQPLQDLQERLQTAQFEWEKIHLLFGVIGLFTIHNNFSCLRDQDS